MYLRRPCRFLNLVIGRARNRTGRKEHTPGAFGTDFIDCLTDHGLAKKAVSMKLMPDSLSAFGRRNQQENAHLNIILLTDALRDVPLTGIGRYVLELAKGLHAHPDVGALRCFAGRDWVETPRVSANPGQGPSGPPPSALARLRRGLPWRSLQDYISFTLKKRAFQNALLADKNAAQSVLHAPNYLLLPFAGPSVTTIHDLSFLHYPECHPVERIRLLDRELPKTLAQAALILTDTEFVRREIIELLGVSPQLVVTVPLGVAPCFRPRSATETSIFLQSLNLKHGVYLLSVATLEPRKNLIRLLRAYTDLPDALTSRFPLVLAGARGWLTRELERLIHPLERAGKVRRLGYIPESGLPLLFAGAAGLALPSLYEGFGLPVLEAMACAVPVLTSNGSSLPEVAGQAALLVNPLDKDAMSHGLQKLLTDNDFREHAKQQGPLQAKRFTWENCICLTLAAYRQTLGKMSA